MSLRRIPMTLIVTILSNKMITPPNPAPQKDEMVSTTLLDSIGNRNIYLHLMRMGHLLIGGTEIIAILATNFPSHHLAQHVLSTLIFRSGDPSGIRMTSLSILGMFLFLVGATARIRAFHELGRFFRFNISIQRDHELITDGMYSYVRHPSYAGVCVADIGWALWFFGMGSWAWESGLWHLGGGRVILGCLVMMVAFGPVMTVSRIEKEEMALKVKLRKEWAEFTKRVPYRLIPWIY